jgi:hypothetical protein
MLSWSNADRYQVFVQGNESTRIEQDIHNVRPAFIRVMDSEYSAS